MIAKIHSAIPYGFNGRVVEVEGDMNRGLPAFSIVGMANKTINEARERVRSAITNSGFSFPEKKVTINLAPAELAKDGSFLDLPIALSVLLLSRQLTEQDTKGRFFVGELSLTGEVRPVRGIINIVEVAKKAGAKEIFVPIKNLPQARLITGIKIHGVRSLTGLYLQLKGQCSNDALRGVAGSQYGNNIEGPNGTPHGASKCVTGPILDHIRGQELAKRAMTIAVAGHHNVLISGPPGAGKTLLAKVAANLLPDLSPEEQRDLTKIYSLAGLTTDEIVTERPFREPHHTASSTSIIGGGAGAMPGEISLAHKGVLFLDEMPEFPRSVLEALRQPLEDKTITISRASTKTSYPADFMLVATMNPCPCGYRGDPTHECKCTETQIQNYQKKLSGPLLDRIDMYVNVERVDNNSLQKALPTDSNQGNEHSVVKNTITEVVRRQRQRYGKDGVYNSSLSSFEISKKLKMTPEAEKLLYGASDKLKLSARSYFKTIKVARTIADLEGTLIIEARHVAEALTYRGR